MRNGVSGGHIYAVLGCKVDWETEGQHYIDFGDSGFFLREGHWRKPLSNVGCQRRLEFLCIVQFQQQGKKLEVCRSKVCSSRKMDEARLLGKLVNCEINETNVNSDIT